MAVSHTNADRLQPPGLQQGAFHCLYSIGSVDWYQARLYLILGDLHGHIQAALRFAIHLQCLLETPFRAVFQVGDFGFWPRGRKTQDEDPYFKREDALDFFTLQSSPDPGRFFSSGTGPLETLDSPLYFIRGNHEDFDVLRTLPQKQPSRVLPGIYFVPDYFSGTIDGLQVAAVGGILTDVERGKGKEARATFKKAQQYVRSDPRLSNAALLVPSFTTSSDLFLSHSGPSSRETRDGSQQLAAFLRQNMVRLHFYGHHHRFSVTQIGSTTLSIGLRNREEDRQARLRKGSFAILAWQNRDCFSVYTDVHE